MEARTNHRDTPPSPILWSRRHSPRLMTAVATCVTDEASRSH